MFKSKIIDSGLVYYSDLIPDLEHFFTTRESVIRSNETDVNVETNIIKMCNYLGITQNNLISPVQTHSSNIAFVEDDKTEYPDTDALILTTSDKAIYLNFADCVPVIIYDKKANIGAIAHAGWRGTVARIVPKTVEKMLEYSHSDINDIFAIIGPAIDKCCYNVGDDVINGVKKSVINYEKLFFYNSNNVFVDLKMTNAQQLIELGVPVDNIDICPYCTSCKNDLFFSYRKENGTTSRHSAIIKLNS